MSRDEIRVVPYDPGWSGKFRAEAGLLAGAFDGIPCSIEHIGSTAVPGLAAKPIIDIAVRVDTIARVPGLILPLAGLGYVYAGEYGLPGRHFFTRGEPRAYHLHIVDDTTDHWDRWIRFRNVLRADERVRRDYAALKEGLAAQHRHERERYTAGKGGFINGVLDRPPPGGAR